MKTALLFTILLITCTQNSAAQSTETILVKRSLMTVDDRSNWNIAASSAHVISDGGNGGPAYLAIDGKASSFWHSVWGSTVLPGATIDIDFGKLQTITGVILQQRDVVNRQIKDLRLYFKTSESDNWILSRTATLTEVFTPQEVSLPTKRTARYMRIEILTKHDNTTSNVCLAEVGITVEERYIKSEYMAMQKFLELPVASTEDKTTIQSRSNWSGRQPTAIVPFLSLPITPIRVTEEAQERTLTISTNISHWSAWSEQKWLQVNTSRNPATSVTINIPSNESLDQRNDTLCIYGGGVLRKIPVNQTGLRIPTDLITSDLYVRPSGSTSTSVYTGSHSSTNLWDRDANGNNFHTAVNNSASPKTENISYVFSPKAPAIDYIIMSNHGNFTIGTLYVRIGDSSEFVEAGQLIGSATGKFTFASQLKDVSAIRLEFTVPPNGGFIYFNELECWKTNTETSPTINSLLNVFEDLSCSAIKQSAEQQDIEALPAYFRTIAKKMRENTYHHDYRISWYKAYSSPELFGKLRDTQPYSPLDNPTGIYAKEGESINVLVGPTHGNNVSLMSVSPGSINRTSYFLKEGINQISISRTGLLYITYNADLTTNPQPIKIHIPEGSGALNRYWDVTKNTDDEWADMLNNAKCEVIDIIGEKMHLLFHVDELKKNLSRSPKISETIKIWDNIVHSQWNLMGYYKYPQALNNRHLAISAEREGLYMSATAYITNYHKNTLTSIILHPSITQGTQIWGPAHEIGHQNQWAINWRSMSESSNNLFSQVALEEVINQKVRKITDATLDNAATEMSRPVNWINQALDGMPNHNMDIWDKKDNAYYQFYLYFHHLGINPDFYKDLFENTRRQSLGDAYLVSERHLNWYKRVCDVAQVDFTGHFEAIGWFTPIDHIGNQYGTYRYLITEALANEAKAYVAAKNYPKPIYRTQFLHQHGAIKPVTSVNGYWIYYRDNAQISDNISCNYSPSNGNVSISNGREAAAFAVETDGKIVMYADRTSFVIPAGKRNSTTKIYAVPIQTAQNLVQIFPKL